MSCFESSSGWTRSAECLPVKQQNETKKTPAGRHSDTVFYPNLSAHNLWWRLFFLFLTDRREAVLLPSLQQGVRRQVQPQGSPTDPLGCEKIPMQELLQNLLQDVSSAQAWGIWVLCSTLTELGYFLFFFLLFFPHHHQRKTENTNCCFFMFSEPGRAVSESHRLGLGGGSFFLFFFCFFFFFFYKWSSSFQSSVCSCASRLKQCFLWLQSASSFVMPCTHLPVLFMHFFCMSRMLFFFFLNMTSQCFFFPFFLLSSSPPLPSSFFFFFFLLLQTIPKKKGALLWMTVWTEECWSHCYLGNKCKLSCFFLGWIYFNFLHSQ